MFLFKKRKDKKVEEKNTPETVQQTQDRNVESKEAPVTKPTSNESKERKEVPVTKPTSNESIERKEVPVTKPTSKENNDKIYKYHVSQNKDDRSEFYKQWRVRKEGSDKTIKYFKTQKEAIEHAEVLAKNAGSSIVIHKVDGTIRKQDYSK
jgi:hypothetical protein